MRLLARLAISRNDLLVSVLSCVRVEWLDGLDASLRTCLQIQADFREPKWRRLRLSNRRVARVIGCHPHALELLKAAGFAVRPPATQSAQLPATSHRTSEAPHSAPSLDQSPLDLVLDRDDHGLVWAAVSALQHWRLAFF